VTKRTAPSLTSGQLEQIAKVLGDTDTGLKNLEIAHLLAQARIKDVDPKITKWRRLYNALARRHNMDRSADRTLAFIRFALDPARYVGNRDSFEARRSGVNAVLVFAGLEFGEDGRFHKVSKAKTLEEAERRASQLRGKLRQRDVHQDVLRYCRAELLKDNYFHAVLEATKSVASKVREKTGLDLDGAPLIDAALGGSSPPLRINALSTESERSEQKGFVNLVKGLFGTFRNPTAHAPRIEWNMSEEDALDLLSLASYVHRRIDGAV
jgi:uncharacterized protein (TIGR02391 family)